MSKSAVPVGAYSSFKDVEERWVKTAMLEGDPIVDKKLGPKGSPPGLVANIPQGMRAFAIEVNEQSGVSGFILPGHRVDVVRFEANDRSPSQRGETILQNILVLAAGQVFTRPEEKALLNKSVTLAVFPEQVDILVAARAKGPLSLSLRGVNDHDIVNRPKPKPEISEEEKARRVKLEEEEKARKAKLDEAEKARRAKQDEEEKASRIKLEKELEELKVALAKKMAEPPKVVELPPPPRPPQMRFVYIYRPDKKAEQIPVQPAAGTLAEQENRQIARQEKLDIDDDEPGSVGFGTTAVTNVDPAGKKSTFPRDH